ncbi:OmpA family protein [Olleya sp. Bg11-27]|uniref:OmpA family protein n=1 Tax=Olleya sp. Bg11-27 TaxID=2058135 RepID=UPI000C316FA9|nr:OmpA family protein [Olleya sp. Bg11-27]AUC74555.1 flagellar motor protein MotB [Olleya sp. Bg11-27]
MSKKTGYLLGILLTIILGTILYWFLCCNCCAGTADAEANSKTDTIESKNDVPAKLDATMNAFAVSDANGNLSFDINDNINFKTSDYHYIEPLSIEVDNGLTQLVDYLDADPSKSINVTGHYRSEETNVSAFPNLGLARANTIKNQLISKGMSSKRINTFGILDDNFNADSNGVLHGPLSYGVNTVAEADNSEEDALQELGDAIKADPLILYFNTAQASINLTAVQRQKVADMVKYTDKVDGAMLNVTGYTDNTGDQVNNVRLGQERADFAKNYLIENGIAANKINSTSKGPDAPIADNATEEGRAKNRRVVVTIN